MSERETPPGMVTSDGAAASTGSRGELDAVPMARTDHRSSRLRRSRGADFESRMTRQMPARSKLGGDQAEFEGRMTRQVPAVEGPRAAVTELEAVATKATAHAGRPPWTPKPSDEVGLGARRSDAVDPLAGLRLSKPQLGVVGVVVVAAVVVFGLGFGLGVTWAVGLGLERAGAAASDEVGSSTRER